MPREVLDRYEIIAEVASGGMATVFLGRLRGGNGFARTVAIKRLHAHLARDPHFVAMFLDEARLAAQIRHANVVSTLDVLNHDGELFIVMDYVQGEPLSRIREHCVNTGKTLPLSIVGAIVSGVLQGLHAAHEAVDERGKPLGIVHRDVSPQNVMVGADGMTRVVDFGVAKAAGRIQTTVDGQIKGKVAYMAPEQISGSADRRTDVFAASVVLWELLAGRRLFSADSHAETLANVLAARVPPLREVVPELSPAIEELVMCGLDPSPDGRYASARTMDRALHRCMTVASPSDVAEWLQATMGAAMEQSAAFLTAALESRVDPPMKLLRASRAEATTGDIPTGLSSGKSSSRTTTRSSRWAPVFVAAALCGLVAAGAWRYRGFTARRGADPTIAAAYQVPAATEPLAPSPSLPVPPPALVTGPAAIAATAASTPDGGTPLPRATSATPRTGAGAGAGAKRSKCDPPFWIDARGQHFKSECL